MTKPQTNDRMSLKETATTYVPGRMDAITVPAGTIGTVVAIDNDMGAYRYRVAFGEGVVVNLKASQMWGPVA